MIVDILDVVTQEDKVREIESHIDMDTFSSKMGSYSIKDNSNILLTLTNLESCRILIEGTITCTLIIPCDRCLKDVETDFKIPISREMDLSKDAEDTSSISKEFALDLDRFAYTEILLNLPVKVLCKSDCKGICNRCGTNLSENTCYHDTKELDPRMAKVLDIFNQFKEV